MKHVGTLIDKNHFENWTEGENLYRICMSCGKPKLLKDKDGLTRGKKHYCDSEKNYWCYAANLDYDGFIFIEPKKPKIIRECKICRWFCCNICSFFEKRTKDKDTCKAWQGRKL